MIAQQPRSDSDPAVTPTSARSCQSASFASLCHVTVLGPLVMASVVVCLDLWVLSDARRWARQGSPVVFRLGSLTMGTPEAWAIACLLAFVIFVPIYVVARRS